MNPRSFICLALQFLFLGVQSNVEAVTTAPLFSGNALVIHGETFNWVSATEDATWHNDTYTGTTSGKTVIVTGLLSFTSLATAIATDNSIEGHLNSGTYADKVQNPDPGSGPWQINGITFTQRTLVRTYTVDFDAQTLIDWTQDDYTGANGTYKSWVSVALAVLSWDLTDSTIPSSGVTSLPLFGSTYTFVKSTSFSHPNDGYDDHGWADYYASAEGGTLKVKKETSSANLLYLEAWDPHAGTAKSTGYNGVLTTALTGITWEPRATRTFAAHQVWLDSRLFDWQSGVLGSDGSTVDTYASRSDNTLSLTLAATALDFQQGTAAAVVSINGEEAGTFATATGFAVPGHMISNAVVNRSAPLFTGTKTVLQVGGTLYRFAGGYEDNYGGRTDLFTTSSGVRLAISGLASAATLGHVRVNYGGSSYTGNYNNGVFSVSGLTISSPSSQPGTVGPPAFWVRGVFYKRISATSTTYETAPGGLTLTLGGTVAAPSLSGTDSRGGFSGSFTKNPAGIFLLNDGVLGTTSVAVLPANADGTVHLSWAPPATGLPPAVEIEGQVWHYLGTAADDTQLASTAAYYGLSVAAHTGTRLLKIRGDGTAVLTRYLPASSPIESSVGTYSFQSHLFQAPGVSSAFPAPAYAVDPDQNDALWHLFPASGEELPPSFMVRGQPWWFAGTDSEGISHYQGYYAGQTLALLPAEGTGVNASREVRLVDPVRNAAEPEAVTKGTFSGGRVSIRLSDGSLAQWVVSGNQTGTHTQNPAEEVYSIHTIASDLDVIGNTISFGILNDDVSLAGTVFSFGDDGLKASLQNVLYRPKAEWVWWKSMNNNDATGLHPVMALDQNHVLRLYPGVTTAAPPAFPSIVLDPAGTSSFKGPIRVPESGDIPMGAFKAGTPP